MTLKKTLFAAALATLSVSPAMAQNQLLTGIGFGADRNQAMSHMIIAWTQGAVQTFGFGDWNTAIRGPVNCVPLQPQASSASTMNTPGADIFTFGDITTASWSCTVQATVSG